MTDKLFYIFLGQDRTEDENCFLNYSNKLKKYFVDSKAEASSVKTKFTYAEFEIIKAKLSNLWLTDDYLILVGELDD